MKNEIPKTFGACADKLYKLREQRHVLQHKADELEAQEKEIKEYLINECPKHDSVGMMGKKAKIQIVTKQVPSVKDWAELHRHILKTKDFSFLARRVSDAAVKERWENGEKVPGVEAFAAISVSVTKI